MKVLGIIPARGGSKGIPDKNLRELGGKPLLQYSIDSALESQFLTDVVLSTDDERISTLGKRLGVLVPFLRPSELATDQTPTLPVIQHALGVLSDLGKNFEAVCLLQPTSPFRRRGWIDRAVKEFELRKTDSLISVLRVPHEFNPHWTFEPNSDGLLHIATGEKTIITRRQDLPVSYYRDGSIYLTRTDVILQQSSLYGQSISYIENDNDYHINLDFPLDWEKAELMLKNIAL
jgi:CMP-N,N'-diacetyllegionaminic acid synthase